MRNEAVRQGAEPHRKAPPPFERFVRWLAAQPSDESRDHWRTLLDGFTGATPLPMDHIAGIDLQAEHGDAHTTLELLLSDEQTSALRHLADAQQVTLDTLLQGAWALLLSRYAGTDDVVFGATRACRGAPVKGVDSMVGLLINTVPVRVAVPATASLTSWLQVLRSQWVGMRNYEQTPLAKILEWSELLPGEPLFESIVVFENFGLTESLQELGAAWVNRSFRLIGTTNYPWWCRVISDHRSSSSSRTIAVVSTMIPCAGCVSICERCCAHSRPVLSVRSPRSRCSPRLSASSCWELGAAG